MNISCWDNMMRYKITRQFSHSKEILIALFDNPSDISIYIEAISTSSNTKLIFAIYRIYDGNKFINEINANNIDYNVTLAQFHEMKSPIPIDIANPFKVTSQSIGTTTEIISAKFTYLDEARIFIEKKIICDGENKKNIIYKILDNETFMGEFNQLNSQPKQKKSKKITNVFRPTPFPMKLRLGPGNYWTDEEEDDDAKGSNHNK